MTLRLHLFLGICFLSFLSVNGQTQELIDIDFKDQPLELVLDSISEKSGYFFSYNADIMPKGSLFTLKREQIKIDKLLSELFIGTHLEFTKIEDQIILRQVIKDSQGNKRVNTRISGWVRDAETDEPIFGAHVFINGSTIGTFTDDEGSYELKGLKPGNYQVVFSHVGYKPAAFEINSGRPSSYVINATLNQETNVLKGVEITSMPLVSDENWIRYYRKFSEAFIGNSANSNKCSFTNPEVLEFAYSDSLETYEAFAKEPLIMDNEGLGYRVRFELEHFKSSHLETRFHVRASFENMIPENRRTRRRWKKNREKSFYGSSFHFFRSLMNDDLRSQGFVAYLVEDVQESVNGKQRVEKEDIIFAENGDEFISFDQSLLVEYKKEFEHPNYQNSFSGTGVSNETYYLVTKSANNIYQRSVLLLTEDKVRILQNGQIAKPEGVQALGYWSWERMSELMPIDYEPKTDNLSRKQ
ncbi:MAG: carboxypeptidase-like regulatory domain-containing protein [Cyclobacteriaceae bacterium]